jgi:SAM-dependent methyltransferase
MRWDRASPLVPRRRLRVLEIGCGLGAFGSLISSRHEYVGLEPDRDAYEIAVDRLGSDGRVLNVAFEDAAPESFDLVCAFEVLEHLEDDVAALRGWRTRIAEGGNVLVSVPAGSHRLGPADEKAGHFRRYDPSDLRAVLSEAGFGNPRIHAYGFPVGFALEWGRNLYASRNPGASDMTERTAASGRWLQPPAWAATATWLAAWPCRIAQRPFGSRGTGLVAVADA